MGIFDFLGGGISTESAVKEMCDSYNQEIWAGKTPKQAITTAFDKIKKRSMLIKHMSAAQYMQGIFRADFDNMSSSSEEARNFAVRVINVTIISYIVKQRTSLESMIRQHIT